MPWIRVADMRGEAALWYRCIEARTFRRGMRILLGSGIAAGVLFGAPAQSADFTVTSGTTDTVAKTLNADETGLVDAGGTLSVTGANAVTASGNNVRFTNNGTASSTTNSIVLSTGPNAVLVNNGTMTAPGIGFITRGANSVLTNNGTITATSSLGRGLEAQTGGDDSVLTNNGTITTPGANGDGLRASANRVRMVNNGTITSADEGIDNNGGTDATLINSGTITTTTDGANGIQSTGNNSTIRNSGTIVTNDTNSMGIQATGANARIDHSGAITVSAAGAAGINTTGTSASITVSGSITAAGGATQAILGGTGDETLNLMPGARIVGTIDLGTGNNAINVFTESGAPSSTLTIANAGSVNTTGGDGLVVRNGNTLAIVDPTNLSASRATLGAVTAGVHQAVGTQLAQSAGPAPLQLAALTTEPGMAHRPDSDFAWVRGFGGRKTRGDDGAVLAYESGIYGTVAGWEFDLGHNRIGVLGGVSRSDLETDIASVETDSSSVFAGGYGAYRFGAWSLGGALVAGYEQHDSERRVIDNLRGEQTALSDYDSYYLSPSVTLSRSFAAGGGWTLRPSAEVSYTLGYYPGYTETGTTNSNLTVEAHTVDVIASRVQLAAQQDLANGRGAVELRAGATHTHYGHDAVDLRLGNGAAVRYEGAGSAYSYGGYGGANARYDLSERLTLVTDLEYGVASKEERSINASIGLELRF